MTFILSFIVAFGVAAIVGQIFIPLLRRLKAGQSIRTDGPTWHMSKQGTPTMGGVLIVGSMTAATLLCARMGNPFIIACLIVTLALGLLGFRDDYLKVAKKTSDGISARKKLLVQFLAGLAGVTFLYLYPEGSPRVELHDYISSLFIPFYGQVNLPWFVYIPFGVVVVMSASNAVNLTDGLDGLASGCSVATGISYAIIAALCGSWLTADSLDIPFHPGAGEISVFMMALVGACLGFLWHNCYPARVFMGDTGSLTIGGIIAVFAILIRKELLIPLLCLTFFLEDLSVMLQVGYFKYTKKKYGEGRRIFKMTPLHHHLQKDTVPGAMVKWNHPRAAMHENKITTRFWIVGLLLAALTFVTLKIR